jgi:hypothetical protein
MRRGTACLSLLYLLPALECILSSDNTFKERRQPKRPVNPGSQVHSSKPYFPPSCADNRRRLATPTFIRLLIPTHKTSISPPLVDIHLGTVTQSCCDSHSKQSEQSKQSSAHLSTASTAYGKLQRTRRQRGRDTQPHLLEESHWRPLSSHTRPHIRYRALSTRLSLHTLTE